MALNRDLQLCWFRYYDVLLPWWYTPLVQTVEVWPFPDKPRNEASKGPLPDLEKRED